MPFKIFSSERKKIKRSGIFFSFINFHSSSDPNIPPPFSVSFLWKEGPVMNGWYCVWLSNEEEKLWFVVALLQQIKIKDKNVVIFIFALDKIDDDDDDDDMSCGIWSSGKQNNAVYHFFIDYFCVGNFCFTTMFQCCLVFFLLIYTVNFMYNIIKEVIILGCNGLN